MNRRIRDMQLKNVVTVLAAPDDPLLMDASIDRFFICDTWHHIENQTQYLALMKKMLKPGGQVIMIDFHKKEMPVGPPIEMRIAREDLVRQMESNGFKLGQGAYLPALPVFSRFHAEDDAVIVFLSAGGTLTAIR